MWAAPPGNGGFFTIRPSSRRIGWLSLASAATLERWRNPAGQPVGMKRLSPIQPAQGRVLMVYGNGSCATGCARYADAIQEAAALDVFILEYPGYADRPGKPSQDALFRAADEGLRLLATNGPVYLVGESLGTGVAAYLAGTYSDKVAGMVLFAPYNRLADVAQYHVRILPVHWLLVERFPSEDFLRQYHGPVAVFVGGKDRVVPENLAGASMTATPAKAHLGIPPGQPLDRDGADDGRLERDC